MKLNYIPMVVLEHRFNDEGNTSQIIVAFQHYQGNEQFNARISLTEEYVKGIDSNLELDRLNKSQIEQYARLRLRDWILESRPEPTEEPEMEE